MKSKLSTMNDGLPWTIEWMYSEVVNNEVINFFVEIYNKTIIFYYHIFIGS